MGIDPVSVLEQIKRARLYSPNLGQSPQSPQSPQSATPVAQGQDQSRRLLWKSQAPVQNQQQVPVQPSQPIQAAPQQSPTPQLPQQIQKQLNSPVNPPEVNSQSPQITPIKPGNIDLSNRPVVRNPDGTSSTVSTITIEEDGHTVLLPTIINGQRVSEKEAINHYHKTGEHMGIFDTEEHADQYDQQLHNKMGWNGPPGSSQEAWQKGQVQAPPSPRDQALADYRQAMQTPAPNQSDYHPSVTRRVLGALLGGAVGLSNPQAGGALGHQAVYGPFDKQLSDYQKKLAQKKEAYETESGVQKEDIAEQEQKARTSAEGERAKAETARRLGEEGKLRSLQPGTPEYTAELEKLKIQHPGTPKVPVPYELTLKNNEKIVGYESQNGQFTDAEGNIYGTDAIKEARKVGTNEPKSTKEDKPPREGEAGAIDQWTQEHGRAPNYSERLSIHRQFIDAPKDSGSSGDFRKEIQMQSARQSAQRPYQRNFDLSTAQLDRLDRSLLMINTAKPEDIALAVPEILTALVSGQGTGVRITTPEMNSMIHARGLGDSIEAFVNKIKGQGNLSDKQKSDLKGLLSDVKAKVVERQKDISDVMDEIDNANNPNELGKAQVKFRKKLTGGNETKTTELPGGITLDDINKEIARRKGAQQ